MKIKKILKRLHCNIFCCFKSSCSYNDSEPKKKYIK